MFGLLFRKMFRSLPYLTGLAILAVMLPKLITALSARARLFDVETVSRKPVAIVFGAGLRRDGSPTAVLRDRIRTAADLYFAGKVDLLLMSGDGGSQQHDEPTAMEMYARRLGVPEEAILLDFAGNRTYDTCYRAGMVFGLEEAILVTQAFHLPRALYTCNALDLNVVGVPASESRYWPGALTYWKLRELVATMTALWDLHVLRPVPVTGEIDPNPSFGTG
jgi:vancomycin permeability regulator SanA